MFKSALLLAAAASACMALAFALGLTSRGEPAGDVRTGDEGAARPGASTSAAARVTAPGSVPRFRLRVGATPTYAYASDATSRIDYTALSSTFAVRDASPASSNRRAYATTCRGKLLLRVYAEEGDAHYVVGGRLEPTTHALDGEETPLLEALRQPFRFHLHRDGRMSAFAFTRGVPPEAEGAVEQIVRSLQLVLPTRPVVSWTAHESSANGETEADYRLRGDWIEPVATVYKTRRAGPAREAAPDRAVGLLTTAQLDILSSAHEAEVELTGGWIRRITGHERLAIRDQGATWATTQTSFEAWRQPADETARLPSTLTDLETCLGSTAYLRTRLYTPPPRALPMDRIRDLAHAVALLRELLGEDLLVAEATFVGFLRTSPDACARLVEVLDASERAGAASNLDDGLRLELWPLIAEAGHREAQAALVSAVANPDFTEASRLRALSALHGVAYPDERTVDGLWQLHRSLTDTATPFEREMESGSLYALGALGQRGTGAGELGRQVATDLEAELVGTIDERATVIALDAIGNHGGTELLPAVRTQLDDPRRRVRVAAFRALRRMQGEAVERTFLAALEDEADPAVRRAASSVLAEWAPSEATVAWARARLLEADTPAEALALVDFLGRSIGRFPENASRLRDLLETRPPRTVRHRVYAYVAP